MDDRVERRRAVAIPTRPVASSAIDAGSGAGLKVSVALFSARDPLPSGTPTFRSKLIERLLVGVKELDTALPEVNASNEPPVTPLPL